MKAAKFLLLAVLAVAPAFSEQPFSVRISLTVDADEVTAPQLRSCVAAALRFIPGVTVSAERPRIQTSIVAVETKSSGYATSLLILDAGLEPQHGVQVAPDLPGMCRVLAADIDQRAVERAREAWQRSNDLTPDGLCGPNRRKPAISHRPR
jgi:hypothetical protein